MKKILLGFSEGYFVVSFIIYVITDFIFGKPINVLFFPNIYPFIFAIFYVAYKFNIENSLSNSQGLKLEDKTHDQSHAR